MKHPSLDIDIVVYGAPNQPEAVVEAVRTAIIEAADQAAQRVAALTGRVVIYLK